jgi:hypothetical protein
METSVFLAKLIGPVFLVAGLAVLISPQRTRQLGREFVDSEALIFLSGIITLPAGLAIVIVHNVWVAGWPVIITIIGWLAVLAGITRMLAFGGIRSIGRAMLDKTSLFAVPGAIMAALGAYLSDQGYLG